jgi:hypothetical protein
MLFRRHPDVAVAPRAKLTQFLHLGMILPGVVFHGQICWIEYTNITTQALQYTSAFERQ